MVNGSDVDVVIVEDAVAEIYKHLVERDASLASSERIVLTYVAASLCIRQ
jgi:hypothetical protein